MVRTLLVVSTRFYRESLASALPRNGSIAIVGTASGRRAALACALSLKPDVVLLDASVAEGQEIVRALNAPANAPRVVVVAITEVPDSIIAWAEAGIAGYVSREQSIDGLISTIECVARGELVCSPRIAASILERVGELAALVRGEQPYADGPSRLTSREQQVVRLMGRGLSNKRIASDLGISMATAKNHVHNILNKLHLHRRSEVASLLDSIVLQTEDDG